MIDTGKVVGNYRIVRELGAGAMGAVYEAVDIMLERTVAIKILRSEIARQPELIERFRVEAVTLAKLSHPSIATLYSFFREQGEYYMVMEFVRGTTLEAMIEQRGRLDPGPACAIIRQTLEGMAHAHRMGVLHRDIKPANIMVSESAGGFAVKVTDFGIARILGSSRMTREGRIIGTLEYIAPERIRGEEADIRSDLYSAGVVLYEMLAGRLPFAAQTDYNLIQAHLQQAPPPLRELGVACPPELEGVLRKALAKLPGERFQSAEEFHGALGDPAPGPKATRMAGVATATPPTRLAEIPRARPLFLRKTCLAAAAGVAALGLAVLGLSLRSDSPASSQPAEVSAQSAAPPPTSAVAEQPAPPPEQIAPPPVRRQFPPDLYKPGTSPATPAAEPVPAAPAETTPIPVTVPATPRPALSETPAPAKRPAGPGTIRAVRTLYIERLGNRLEDYIRQELGEQLGGRITVVEDQDDADAVLSGSGEKHSGNRFTAGFRDEFTASVSISSREGERLLWSSEAGDRYTVIGVMKHGGPKKVAERLVGNLKKAIEKKPQ